MAAEDVSIPRKFSGEGVIELYGGGGESLTMIFVGELTWEETGTAWTEARDAGKHKTTPVAVETEDGNVSLSLSGLITSFLGSSNTYLYEVFNGTSGWTRTTAGGKTSFGLRYTSISGDVGSNEQVANFAFCIANSASINPNGADGLCQIELDITDLENHPTWS